MNVSEAAKILKLQAPFTAKQAKDAYRKLALIHHPDKGGVHEKMVELNIAYKLCAKGVTFGKEMNWSCMNDVPFEVKFSYTRPKPKISNVIRWFGQKMLNKLAKNKHKGFLWRSDNASVLLDRLEKELQELDDVLDSGDKEAIINECADIANFAMFIADKAERQL